MDEQGHNLKLVSGSAEPLRCLFVSTARHTGGAEQSLSLLVRHMAAAGQACAVAHAGAVRDITPGADSIGVVAFEPLRRPGVTGACSLLLRWAWDVVALCLAIARLRPHVIHANTTAAALVSVIPAWLTRCPLVWHVRDLVPLGRWGRLLASRASAIIAVSHAVRESLVQCGIPEQKIQVVPNGVDGTWISESHARESARVRIREQLGFPAESFVFLSVGQYVGWKRHDLLLAAAARLLQAWPAARFVVIGGRPVGGIGNKSTLAGIVAHTGLEPYVRLLDWQDDLRHWLTGADVLVHTAGAEPFGRVLIEAMACSLPVICARAAGPLDIIEHNRSGLFFEPGDVHALTNTMLQVASDPGLAGRLARAGRERVGRRFTADAVARQVLGIYRDVAGIPDFARAAGSREVI